MAANMKLETRNSKLEMHTRKMGPLCQSFPVFSVKLFKSLIFVASVLSLLTLVIPAACEAQIKIQGSVKIGGNVALGAGGVNLTGLSPNDGLAGTVVTITGTNFGSAQGSSTVTFNGTPAAPASLWTSTSIQVAAPAGSNTGPVVVTVNGVASNGMVFTYSPIIASLSPASGPAGELVIINGQHFGSAQGNGAVALGTLPGQVVLWTDTQIQATVASGSVTGVVQVTQGGNASNSLAFAVLPMYNSSFNNSNQLTSTASASFTYDNNGNIASKTDANGTTTYTWDFENRLTSVVLPGNGGTISFKYDPFGRRIEKLSPANTTVYAYDGDNVVEELNGSGTPVAQYTQGLGIDEPLAMNRASATSFYQADGLGSVTSLTDGSGQIAASYTYDSFGNLTASTGTISNPFRFTARDYDSETGLYYYRARYYDPTVGRFLSEDPAEFSGGDVNLYRYVADDPVDWIDSDGLGKQRGAPGKGERKQTGRPEGTPNPGKHARPSKQKPGCWEVKDPHTGKWVVKPPGWVPFAITDFELQMQLMSAQYIEQFWADILVGDAVAGAVGIGGAIGGAVAAPALVPESAPAATSGVLQLTPVFVF